MEITKKQNFIYSIWVILILIWGIVQLLSITAYSFLSWTNVEIMAIFWLIPVLTSRHKKAWIRFLSVLSLFIAVTAIIRYIYTIEGLNFLELSGLHLVIKGLHLAFMIWAVCVRKQVVEQSVLAKMGVKAETPVNKTKGQKKAAGEWVKSQQKKQSAKRLDLDDVAIENMTEEAVESKIDKNVSVPHEEKDTAFAEQPVSAKLDINKCSADEFLTLPGMSLISAKRAVGLRETQGDYQSVDDFVARNAIKPHFMVQMEPLITVTEKKDGQTPVVPRRRTLDI